MSANTPTHAETTEAEVTPRPKSRARKLLTSFGFQILAALVLGVVLGLVARNLGDDAEGNPNGLAATLATIGSSYVTILTAAVVPLILTAVISSIAQLRLVTNAARLAGQTLLWFGITALIAVTIGIALGVTIQPGSRVDQSQLETGDVNSTIAFNVLQVIVIAVVIGIAALRLGKRAEPFLEFTASALAVIQKVLWWIIRIAPLGTLGLIASAVVNYGWEKLTSLAWFAIAIYIGLALVLFVVYPILVKAHGLSIGRFFSGVWPAVQLAFVSRSSIGTLPLTQRVTERNLGVPREYASFAVPFGATTKMDGCAAIYPAIAAIFVAQFFNIELSIMQYILIVIVSVVGSAATAGTTGATVMLTLTLSTLGLPLEGVGLLLAIDPILDMGRTATNVAGQALVPMIVAKREGILNEKLYNAPRGDVAFSDETDEEVEETIQRSTGSQNDREQDAFEGATLQEAERRS